MKHFLLGAFVGIVVGAVGAIVLSPSTRPFPAPSADPRAPTVRLQPHATPEERAAAAPAARAGLEKSAATPGHAASPPPAPALVPTEVDTLKRRINELEQKLVYAIGKERPFPADLDPRYTQEPLRKAFDSALKSAGFDGQVTAVDCSEYPCIVFGDGFGGPGDMKRLQAVNAFKDYEKANWRVYGWNTEAKTAGERFFGAAVLAPGENMDDEMTRRLKVRIDEMHDAWIAGNKN